MAAQKHNPRPFTAVIIIISVVLFSLIIVRLSPLAMLDLDFLDTLFQIRGPLDIEDSPIVIITIDDQSDHVIPERWPWPRSYMAHVVRNLNRAGAAAVAADPRDRAGARAPEAGYGKGRERYDESSALSCETSYFRCQNDSRHCVDRSADGNRLPHVGLLELEGGRFCGKPYYRH